MTELDVPEMLRTALMYISMGKIPEVVELFQDVHYKDPENQEILYCFGTMMVVLQDYDSAARILKKLLALNPGYVNAHIALAHIYFNTNKVEEAIATLENSVQYDQDHIYLLENMNMMYSYAGMNEKAQEVFDHI
ncbi:MAG TPA: tetratricopeptide repeat protein, partial [Methanospirillum sp.]|nr:tetratricopeptide repeat protein [Methanospirillum sp.]